MKGSIDLATQTPQQHLVRFHLPEEVTATGMFVERSPSGAFILVGLAGTDKQGKRVQAIAFEWPTAYADPAGTAADRKAAAEERHLARIRVDVVAGTGHDLYDGDAKRGAEPPDFVCHRGQDPIGVEMTQLVLRDRVAANSMFRKIKRAVLSTDHNRFRSLHGHVVYVSFDGLPFKNPNEIRALINGLASFSPPPAPNGPPPEHLDMTMHARTVPGAQITATPLSSDPRTLFSGRMGWELVLAQSSFIRDEDAWEILEKLVAGHDKPGVDELIVAAGAPVATGLAYPTDELLANAIVRLAPTKSLTTTHIRRIFVHVWSGRAVVELTPGLVGLNRICGDIRAR